MSKKNKAPRKTAKSKMKEEKLSQDSSLDDWEVFDAQTYQETASKFVDFSTKTANSNASPGGVRLSPGDKLDLPYLSARTLLAFGVDLDLDYIANTGSAAKITKQMYAVRNGMVDKKQLAEGEKEAIEEGFKAARKSGYQTGLEKIDARLRQILIPKDDTATEYVSFTPLTAGGLCKLFFDSEKGLITRHNEEFRKEKAQKIIETDSSVSSSESSSEQKRRRYISQARFGIGGANPQNVGNLVRSMQRPIFLQCPNSLLSSRTAFSLYYNGLRFDHRSLKLLRPKIEEYKRFRDNLQTNLASRSEEIRIMHCICDLFIQIGEEAFETLQAHQSILPKEFRLHDEDLKDFELVSRLVPGVIRGFIDPRLRGVDYSKSRTAVEINWPREAAYLIVGKIVETKTKVNGEIITLIPLDTAARNSLAAIIEEYLR